MSDSKTAEAKILVYGVPAQSPEGKRLRELAAEKNIRVKDIRSEDFSQRLGYVAGLAGFAPNEHKYDGEAPQHSILWFVSLDRDTLNWFLQQYAQDKSLKHIDLKSVLTEHNVNWTLIAHYQELQTEHKVMQAYTLLANAQGAFESLKKEDFSEKSYEVLAEAVAAGREYVKAMQAGREVDPSEIDRLAKEVKRAYQELRPRV